MQFQQFLCPSNCERFKKRVLILWNLDASLDKQLAIPFLKQLVENMVPIDLSKTTLVTESQAQGRWVWTGMNTKEQSGNHVTVLIRFYWTSQCPSPDPPHHSGCSCLSTAAAYNVLHDSIKLLVDHKAIIRKARFLYVDLHFLSDSTDMHTGVFRAQNWHGLQSRGVTLRLSRQESELIRIGAEKNFIHYQFGFTWILMIFRFDRNSVDPWSASIFWRHLVTFKCSRSSLIKMAIPFCPAWRTIVVDSVKPFPPFSFIQPWRLIGLVSILDVAEPYQH